GARVFGAAGLVHLPEATVGGRAGRKAEGGAVDGQIALRVRIVERVDDGDGLAHAAGGRQLVRRDQVRRVVAGRTGGGRGVARRRLSEREWINDGESNGEHAYRRSPARCHRTFVRCLGQAPRPVRLISSAPFPVNWSIHSSPKARLAARSL